MASFGRPINRKTADRLIIELLDRARAYNADPSKPMFIDTLRVFGSYLDAEVDPVGDVDVELAYGRRITGMAVLRAYTKASGRSFNTYMDEVLWPSTELFLHLKKRSAFISLTTEDITLLTSNFRTIYRIDNDRRRSAAAGPDPDRQVASPVVITGAARSESAPPPYGVG